MQDRLFYEERSLWLWESKGLRRKVGGIRFQREKMLLFQRGIKKMEIELFWSRENKVGISSLIESKKVWNSILHITLFDFLKNLLTNYGLAFLFRIKTDYSACLQSSQL